MWIYEQATGKFRHNDEAPCVGYSGYGPGKNQPDSQNQVGIGPIPQGAYNIGAEVEDDPLTINRHGPVALHLLPCTGTQTFGRSGFLMHGDNIEHPGQASHGCIILPRPVRERVRDSNDKLLVVLSGRMP